MSSGAIELAEGRGEEKEKEKKKKKNSCAFVNLETLTWQVGKNILEVD